jgi:mycothiol synthase
MEHFSVRRPTLDDADAVAALLVDRDRVDFGETDGLSLTGDDLRNWWSRDEARLVTDAWVALRGKDLLAYALVRPERDLANLADESSVHPEARGLGIGTRLLDEAERWARDRGLARFQVHVVNEDGRRLVEERGHRLVRFFWRMEIHLDVQPAAAVPPVGVAIRPYRPGADDAEVHAVVQQAFAEHWEFTPEPFDEWLRGRQRRNDYHPSLWQVAEEDGGIVGAALCFGEGRYGWVLELGVRPSSRRSGLGLALLQAGFGALAARGHTHVGLEVDSENETGATRLYERAGMHVTRRYATYEKALA